MQSWWAQDQKYITLQYCSWYYTVKKLKQGIIREQIFFFFNNSKNMYLPNIICHSIEMCFALANFILYETFYTNVLATFVKQLWLSNFTKCNLSSGWVQFDFESVSHQDQSSLQTIQLSPPANCTKSSVLIHITVCSSVHDCKIAIQDSMKHKMNFKWEIMGRGWDFTHQDFTEFWKVVYDIIANFAPPVWPGLHQQKSHFWAWES